MADELDELMAEATSFAETCSTVLAQPAEPDAATSGEVVEEALHAVEQELAGLEAAFEESDAQAESSAEAVNVTDETGPAAEPIPVEADAGPQEPAAAAASTDPAPQSAPKEWIEEAGIEAAPSADVSVPPETALPDISEDGVRPSEPAGLAARARALVPECMACGARGLRRAVSLVVGVPLLLLRIIDVPFAGLSTQTKTFIGCLAIATLIVAIATWVAGSYNILQP